MLSTLKMLCMLFICMVFCHDYEIKIRCYVAHWGQNAKCCSQLHMVLDNGCISPGFGEVCGDLQDSPHGSLWHSPHCSVGHSLPGCCCWHMEPQACVCHAMQGWIDPCSKKLQIEKLIMWLCHTMSSETRIVLDIVWQAYPAKPKWGAAFFPMLAFIPPIQDGISTCISSSV